MRRLLFSILLLPTLLSLLLIISATNPSSASAVAGKRVVGYFASWDIYDRNYLVKNIVTSGSASRLTTLNYAFANIGSNLKCALGDPWADYQVSFNANQAVNGVADSSSQPLLGNFNQLRELKAKYPGLKVVISIGGWTWSDKFSDAALPANRVAFVRSCIDMFIKGNFAPGVTRAGIFDGIDIDWEYPGACGNTCNFRAEDTQNYTALLAEFRKQLNAYKPGLLLTIAAPADQDKIDKIQVSAIQPYLNWTNLMTYDYHGDWDDTTNFNSPLYVSPDDPTGSDGLSSSDTVRLWQSRGAPARKLVLGVPFYGHGWTGVPNVNNGLWQPAAGVAPGKYDSDGEDYRILKTKGYTRFFNNQAKQAWLYSPTTGIFWTFDDAAVMKIKANYVKSKSLGGVMFWEIAGDTAGGELIKAIYSTLAAP